VSDLPIKALAKLGAALVSLPAALEEYDAVQARIPRLRTEADVAAKALADVRAQEKAARDGIAAAEAKAQKILADAGVAAEAVREKAVAEASVIVKSATAKAGDALAKAEAAAKAQAESERKLAAFRAEIDALAKVEAETHARIAAAKAKALKDLG
jgi:colicin import membrane protein